MTETSQTFKAEHPAMDPVQKKQSEEYQFPYHYLAQPLPGGFRSFRDWNWALQYVTALELVHQRLLQTRPDRHIDIGCGDGALLHFLQQRFDKLRLVGVDYDQQAIALAKLMAPEIEVHCRDIIRTEPEETFDSASMIEVFEHIPPEIADDFLQAVRKQLNPGARLLVTVPHANLPVIEKHYRHFTMDTLKGCVEKYFVVTDMFVFERWTRLRGWANRLKNKKFFLEIDYLNRMVLKEQISQISRDSEQGYCRIFAELTPR